MLRIKLIGVGAAGNKAAIAAFEAGVIAEDELLLINSNLGDVPEAYKQYCIVLSDKVKGTGKERDIARKIAIEYLDSVGNNKVDTFVDDADLVCVVNSPEGVTGSGSSSVLYKYLLNVSNKNVMGFVFTGFEEDGRGLKNTVEYFKDLDEKIALQIISNRKFLPLLGKNKLRAEKMANEEFVRRLAIVSGREMLESAQNIDRTDLLKIVTTPGYLLAEYMELDPQPQNMSQFNRLLEDMVAESKSLPTNATAKRIGVIIDCPEDLERAIDFSFSTLVNAYGTPYELFTHVQNTGDAPGICVLAAGLDMPLGEVQSIYRNFQKQAEKVAEKNDSFANAMEALLAEDPGIGFSIPSKAKVTQEELLEKKQSFFDKLSK